MKGKKRLRNQPVFHGEVKSSHNVMLTPSSWKKIRAIAVLNEISVSELIEQWIQSIDGE